jgi:hypothetical protein
MFWLVKVKNANKNFLFAKLFQFFEIRFIFSFIEKKI